MSIFGDMFDDESSPQEGASSSARSLSVAAGSWKIPPPPRCSSGLCGIYNQGATCYLNSLLQTLIMTPEFKEALFRLDEDELGKLSGRETNGSKVRVIPLQMQKLFSEVLLSNQQGASTTMLTDSFGWTNNEELQQHDVQELNRILFSAIEDSLVGTSGQDLIKDLYHGSIVNQTICDTCGRVSERDEDFLDLSLTVAGTTGVEESLHRSFVEMEQLTGNNQYKCDNCAKLVNARKGARLRHLPSIMSLSLLRFSFDFVKLERYKETGKYTFPTSIDMRKYCENPSSVSDTEYELFSVVIHRGSTHGGHYHAYIRDVDGLGKWTHPDDEEIQILTDPATGKVDFIEFDSPLELLQAILAKKTQEGMDGVAVDSLGSELVKQTGVSWNKRFKRQHGPIIKFIKKYDDKFEFDPSSNMVRLKSYIKPVITMTSPDPETNDNNTCSSSPPAKEKKSEHVPPRPGYCWFDFDDSRVRPITEEEIEKQFSGKESAYMLFYRRKTMTRPLEAYGDPVYGLPNELIAEVLDENIKLDREREEYETGINTIELEVHFGACYELACGALKPLPGTNSVTVINFDRRKTTGELKTMVYEIGGVLIPPNDLTLHHAKELPSGLHPYSCLTDDLSTIVMNTPLANRSKIFAWDGQQVNGKKIPVGEEFEPVLLTITHGNPDHFSHGFPKMLFLGELRKLMSDASGIPISKLCISRVITKGRESSLVKVLPEDDQKRLAELDVVDGDHFIAEDTSVTGTTLAESTIARQSMLMSLLVENRCNDPSENWPVFVVEANRDITVAELKTIIKNQMNLNDVLEGGRLRIDDDDKGLGTPLHEDDRLDVVGLKQGMRVVIEPGAPPLSSEVTICVTHHNPATKWTDLELTVDKNMKLTAFLQETLDKAGLDGDEWHLRKTNWCGEEAQVLDSMSSTLASNGITDGQQVSLCVGKLPPHGYIHLPVWLLRMPASPTMGGDESMLTWITNSIQGLLGGGTGDSETSGDDKSGKGLSANSGPLSLGELLVSKEMTLEELKVQIMTMPKMGDIPIPTPNHVRLRFLESMKPTTVLRGLTSTVQRLKLTSASTVGCQILPQEEDMNQNQILLSIQIRMTGTRTYLPSTDLIWDLTRAGASPQGLRLAISEALNIPSERLLMAKHFPDKYEWMIIKNTTAKSGKGKKKNQNKVNLRHAPFHIKDGDVIGVKDLLYDKENQEDMSTEEDDHGKLRLQEEAEDRRKRREENRNSGDILRLGADKTDKRRREVGIKIHVGDFR